MDDRRVRRPPGALRDRLFSVLMAVSVVVATGTVPASAAQAEPVRVEQVDVPPAPATSPHDVRPDVETLDTARAVQRAAAVVLAQAVAVEAERVAEAARALEAEQAAEVARAADVAAAAQVAQTVTQVQQALLTLGYQGVGATDGIAGTRTAAAIEAFQVDAGHPVTGTATAETLTQLHEKVDAGWRRPAPPARPARPSAGSSPASPAGTPAVAGPIAPIAPIAPAAPAAPAAPVPVWTTYVANTGNQATIDLCAGGLTSFRGDDGNPYFTVPYLTIHNTCGGAPILGLTTGDVVAITGGGVDGSYQVVDSRDVSQGSTTSAVAGLSGDIYLQTCYFNSTTMRIVGAVKVS